MSPKTTGSHKARQVIDLACGDRKRMGRATTREFFVTERLVEARDARGVTQADVAQSLAKPPGTISKWERGEQAPEPESLEQLARALSIPSGYFLRRMPSHGKNAIFFRSFANATVRARAKERAKMRWLQHTSLALQETLEFPRVNLPRFVEPSTYLKLKEDDLERIAEAVRKQWNLGESPIANIVLVAENAGIVIGIDEVGNTRIDGQANWSACDDRPYILLARDKYTAFRRQMDVAHELAHLILHYGIDEAELERHFDLIEHQAKYLACAFLLPHRSFAAEIYSLSLDGFLGLKKRWKVSVGAMIKRARDLDILSEVAEKRLWQYRATRGWHRREPYDLPTETPVEEPRLLRRSVELIVDNKVRTKTDLLESDICLGPSDVEMLASLPANYFLESASVVPFEPKLRDAPPAGTGGSTVVPLRRS
jgi:Zn-dependent peptidase ImmA (M78 family)/DNA-binding transcriptional regulator YiaG